MTLRSISSHAAGYSAVHCRIATSLLMAVATSKARRTSSRLAPPVDMIIGLPISATWRMSGMFVRSPEAIL